MVFLSNSHATGATRPKTADDNLPQTHCPRAQPQSDGNAPPANVDTSGLPTPQSPLHSCALNPALELQAPNNAAVPKSARTVGRIPKLSHQTTQTLLKLSNPNSLQGLEDFESRIEELDRIFLANEDPRGVFTSLYRVITNKAAQSVRNNRYQDPQWGAELTVDFGKRYLENLHAHLQGNQVDAGWQRYYDLANNPRVDLKRVVAMGATIHLVVDLPASLAEIQTPNERRADFMKFGNILLEDYPEMITASQQGHGVDMSEFFDLFVIGDLIDSRHGEGSATEFGFQTIRNKAWNFGQWLQDARRPIANAEITMSWRIIDGVLANMDALNAL